MGLILFIAGMFLLIYLIGKLLEKIRIPWVFSALIIGLALAVYNPFKNLTSSSSFVFMAQLGMYFMLFIIGFELDIKRILKQKVFVIKTTSAVIFAETFFGTLLIHYVFQTAWLISLLVAASFSTVGEAMLLPILDEFNLIKTKLGQTILSIGVLDDIVEILTIIFASILIGRSAISSHQFGLGTNFLILAVLFGLAFILIKISKYLQPHYAKEFKKKDRSSLFLLVMFSIFLFIGIGQYVDSAALGALLAGITLRFILPKNTLSFIDLEVKTMIYGFFAPLFFLWVGIDTDVSYLIKFPLLIILIIMMTKITKITISYLMGRKVLGGKKSIIMGIGLCVKFSTSIVIIKLLFENGVITSNLYSILVGTTIAFKFLVPFLMSYFIKRWHIKA